MVQDIPKPVLTTTANCRNLICRYRRYAITEDIPGFNNNTGIWVIWVICRRCESLTWPSSPSSMSTSNNIASGRWDFAWFCWPDTGHCVEWTWHVCISWWIEETHNPKCVQDQVKTYYKSRRNPHWWRYISLARWSKQVWLYVINHITLYNIV